jgi:SdpC family antimicrobial peptide
MAVLLAGAAVPVAPPAAAAEAAEAEAKDAARRAFSDDELFSGLLLGGGRVATLFPEVWQNPTYLSMMSHLRPEQRAKVPQGRAELLRMLRETEPELIPSFAQDVRTGEHVRIQHALDRALKSIMGLLPSQAARASDSQAGMCIVINGAVVINVAFVAWMAIAAVSWAAIAIAEAVYFQENLTNGSLSQEMYVNLIAERLAVE